MSQMEMEMEMEMVMDGRGSEVVGSGWPHQQPSLSEFFVHTADATRRDTIPPAREASQRDPPAEIFSPSLHSRVVGIHFGGTEQNPQSQPM